jgi:hypothetical protein
MDNILKLPTEEQRTIFRNTAQKMNVSEAVIEKDYWVCLVLDYLFHTFEYRNYLSFKGGTSLSKCFDLIRRFSEDIDLIFDWRLLGYELDEPWIERSKTKQEVFNKQANTRAELFIIEKFLPMFKTEFSDMIGTSVNVEIDIADPLTVNVHYPQLFSTDSILQVIRLETGALAAWTPAVTRNIIPYIFEYYPNLSQKISTTVTTSSAERTFWEKVTILHHEANRPEHLEMPMRYSRHYYDLFCISKSEHKTSALSQLDLLQKVVAFKTKFYPRTWAKYDEAMPGSMRLVPSDFRFQTLRDDYNSMEEMFFGEYPAFDELIESIFSLEHEINSLKYVP